MSKEFVNLGVSGLNRQGGYVYEEFLPILTWPGAHRVYQEMADNDPVVGAILYVAETMIRNTEWTVKGGGDSDSAQFLTECMNDMDTSWADTISEILSVLTYGFSFHEVVYKVRKGPEQSSGKYRSNYSDGKIGWRRIPIRAQSTLHSWEFDEEGDIKAFVQQAPPMYGLTKIPLSKGLLFRTKIFKDNPEGRSLLRNAYRPWYFKKHIEEIEAIGIERDLAGLPVMKAPEGADLWDNDDTTMVMARAVAEDIITNIRRDGKEGVLLPYGWELELLSTGSSRQFDTNEIINRYDNRIAITMLSDIILIGDKSGSFAMADNKQAVLSTALQSQVQNIADIFNKYAVPTLMKMNGYTTEEFPEIVPGRIEPVSIKDLSLLLRAVNLDISEDFELMNFIRDLSGLPLLEEEKHRDIYGKQAETNSVSERGNSGGDKVDDEIDNMFERPDGRYEARSDL